MQDMVTKIVARAKRLEGLASSDKSLSPALLVAQAPGSGKSHFLAELGENISSLWDLDGKLQRPIVSVFTYNSAMGDKWTDGFRMSNSGVDLGLRVLFGAAYHMRSTGLRCKSWTAFLDAINHAVSSENMLQSLVDLNFVVKILRHWYGARPLLILADEMGRSDDEGLARQRLCQLMDSWAGQVSVVMSALSDYEGAVNMFNASIRPVEFQILIVLGTDTFSRFQSVLTVWDRNKTKNAILAYRISLAWGATAGYARAVQYLTAELNKARFKGPSGGSIMGCIAKLGDMGVNLPPQFRADELEALLETWDSRACPYQQLARVSRIKSLQRGIYQGSVLVEARQTSQQQRLFMPTVAAWHAASWFENSFNPVESFPRVAKLQHMMGEAYRAKCKAIESDNETHMKQAASYFTEVTGALGAMLAIVKGHEKLPQALKTSCGSFLDIGFNDSLAQDPALATANKHEAQQKLESFLREARELGINHCGTSPFLVIMAPPNCMALDFVIFRRENASLVAVQVKSNTLLNQEDVEEQSKKLHKAAETVRQRNVEFLAVLGSNFPKGFIDDLFSLQQEDLVLLLEYQALSGPTASELALNDCKCVQGFGCKWCRHVVNHKYALHLGIMVRLEALVAQILEAVEADHLAVAAPAGVGLDQKVGRPAAGVEADGLVQRVQLAAADGQDLELGEPGLVVGVQQHRHRLHGAARRPHRNLLQQRGLMDSAGADRGAMAPLKDEALGHLCKALFRASQFQSPDGARPRSLTMSARPGQVPMAEATRIYSVWQSPALKPLKMLAWTMRRLQHMGLVNQDVTVTHPTTGIFDASTLPDLILATDASGGPTTKAWALRLSFSWYYLACPGCPEGSGGSDSLVVTFPVAATEPARSWAKLSVFAVLTVTSWFRVTGSSEGGQWREGGSDTNKPITAALSNYSTMLAAIAAAETAANDYTDAGIDLSGYYTIAETDAAILAALVSAQTDAAITAAKRAGVQGRRVTHGRESGGVTLVRTRDLKHVVAQVHGDLEAVVVVLQEAKLRSTLVPRSRYFPINSFTEGGPSYNLIQDQFTPTRIRSLCPPPVSLLPILGNGSALSWSPGAAGIPGQARCRLFHVSLPLDCRDREPLTTTGNVAPLLAGDVGQPVRVLVAVGLQ
ncbi:unnamed protein product [Symbiodinium sp. CCMP2592]|nr:unnamed protein product [Symbiodinium sp. CCMP2592]